MWDWHTGAQICIQFVAKKISAALSLKVTEAGYRSVTCGSKGRICLTPHCHSQLHEKRKKERVEVGGGRERERERGKVAESKRIKKTRGKMNGKLNLKSAGICWAALGPSLGFLYLKSGMRHLCLPLKSLGGTNQIGFWFHDFTLGLHPWCPLFSDSCRVVLPDAHPSPLMISHNPRHSWPSCLFAYLPVMPSGFVLSVFLLLVFRQHLFSPSSRYYWKVIKRLLDDTYHRR